MGRGIMLVDANAVGNAHNNMPKLTAGDMPTQAIYGTTLFVESLIREYGGWNNLWVWDGRAQWRFDFYPAYKSNRSRDEASRRRREEYHAQVPAIREMLTHLGISQMVGVGLEADDIAGGLSRRFSREDKTVILVSTDMDWVQLVNENVRFYDPFHGKKKISHLNFFEMTGYRTPRQFLDGKILTGDSSDCITPVGGLGKEKAPLFLAEFGSVENFYRMCESGEYVPKSKIHKRLLGSEKLTKEEWMNECPSDLSAKEKKQYEDKWEGQGRVLYERNKKLMNLIDSPDVTVDQVIVKKGDFNKEAFEDFCARHAFMSILKSFETFIKPFEESWNERRKHQ